MDLWICTELDRIIWLLFKNYSRWNIELSKTFRTQYVTAEVLDAGSLTWGSLGLYIVSKQADGKQGGKKGGRHAIIIYDGRVREAKVYSSIRSRSPISQK